MTEKGDLERLGVLSLEDLGADFVRLGAIAAASRASLAEHARKLATGHHVPQDTRRDILDVARLQVSRYDRQIEDLGDCHRASRHEASPELVARLDAAKLANTELLRARQAVTASLLVATDWHSPSISHSVYASAGHYTHRVVAYRDDYKRDRHPDGRAFEREWLCQYVDNPSGHDLRALMTSSGMSAFTTILELIRDKAIGGRVLVGSGTYHECRQLLERAVGRAGLIEFNESGTADLLLAVNVIRPRAIFLDSLCNAKGIDIVDLETLIRHLNESGSDAYLVIDNTARSVTFQPWKLLPKDAPLARRLLEFESVTKYAQLGFDRSAAGMIVVHNSIASQLDDLRERLGTNISDVAVHGVPRPQCEVLTARLERMGRNAEILASALHAHTENWPVPVDVVHPSLPNHRCFERARHLVFRGSCLALDPPLGCHQARVGLMRSIMRSARRMKAPLMEGTSFGFDTTRVYLTAAHTAHGAPFIRIAVGTEHRLALHRLTQAFVGALDEVHGPGEKPFQPGARRMSQAERGGAGSRTPNPSLVCAPPRLPRRGRAERRDL